MDEATTAYIILAGLLLCALHPRVHPQNYTHEETTCIVGFTMGFLLGKQLADEHGITNAIQADTENAMVVHYVLRIIIGFAVVLPSKEVIKKMTAFMRTQQGKKQIDTYSFGMGDFVSKITQYVVGYGMGVTFFAPVVFKMLGI